MRTYLAHFFAAIFLVLVVTATCNWLVDPYWAFNGPDIAGVNSIKPRIHVNQRLFEIQHGLMLQPKAVVLGTSRADQGIDPSYPGFHFSPVFNLATASQPYKETRRILEMLSDPKYGRLKQAVIGLDFTMSNHLVPFPADYSEDVFSPWYRARLLPSVFTLLDSYRTITQQEAAPFLQANNQLWRKDGFHIVSGTVGKGHALLFDESERHYFRDNYNIPPTCTHDFYPPDVAAPPNG
jgi:hypothetical protein